MIEALFQGISYPPFYTKNGDRPIFGPERGFFEGVSYHIESLFRWGIGKE